MPKSDNEKRIIRFVVDANTVFSKGYSRSNIAKEPHFGKHTDVLHVEASEETCRDYEKMEESEHKRNQRANKCMHKEDGRCHSTMCKGCPNYIPAKDGSGTLSLTQFIEVNGDIFEDTFHTADPEQELEKKEFWETLERFKDSLSEEERALAEAIINGTPDKELMRKLGITKQSTCNSRKKTIRMKMQVAMADYKNN